LNDIPSFCYRKAFWVILGLMVTGGLSVGSWGWALVDEVKDTSIENKVEIAQNRSIISMIPDIYYNQIVICESLNLPCR